MFITNFDTVIMLLLYVQEVLTHFYTKLLYGRLLGHKACMPSIYYVLLGIGLMAHLDHEF